MKLYLYSFIWLIYRFFKRPKSIAYKSINDSDLTSGITSVSIEVNGQPKRLTRSVRLTNLDLVITIGSIISLFFGASLLTFMNIVHIWILRRFWITFSLNILKSNEITIILLIQLLNYIFYFKWNRRFTILMH